MFAAASSFFARTNISQSYNIGSSVPQGIGSLSRPATPGGNTTSLTAPAPATPTFFIGLWKVQSAWHKVTNKRVSVWIFDKRGPDVERLSPQAKERAIEVMKAEVICIFRCRHCNPLILSAGVCSGTTASSFNTWCVVFLNISRCTPFISCQKKWWNLSKKLEARLCLQQSLLCPPLSLPFQIPVDTPQLSNWMKSRHALQFIVDVAAIDNLEYRYRKGYFKFAKAFRSSTHLPG